MGGKERTHTSRSKESRQSTGTRAPRAPVAAAGKVGKAGKAGEAGEARKGKASSAPGKAPGKPGKVAGKPGKAPGKPGKARKAGKSRPGAQPAVDVPRILEILAETWSDAHVELDHESAYELLVATILSAQSTGKRINQVTPALFARYPNARALAGADQAELEEQIRSTGFFRMKAKHLLGMARAVVERHDGEIPRTMDELVALPGVARKTANVVLGSFFGIPSGIVADTHVTRLARRLGLTSETDPEKIERDLMAVIPRSRWIDFAHQLIWHGRRICFARKPACDVCPLAPLCPSAGIGARAVPAAPGEAGEAGDAR